MKKPFLFKYFLVLLVFLTSLADVHVASGQDEKKQQFPIPDNINRIFQSSCLCHGNDGGRLPKSKLNFSRWMSYDAAKESEKASSICNQIRKGKMPPKSARESNPALIPTKEQIDLICAWAESLKAQKEKK